MASLIVVSFGPEKVSRPLQTAYAPAPPGLVCQSSGTRILASWVSKLQGSTELTLGRNGLLKRTFICTYSFATVNWLISEFILVPRLYQTSNCLTFILISSSRVLNIQTMWNHSMSSSDWSKCPNSFENVIGLPTKHLRYYKRLYVYMNVLFKIICTMATIIMNLAPVTCHKFIKVFVQPTPPQRSNISASDL